MSKQTLKVRVRDSLNIIYEGESDRISSYNEVGPFDIFPQHANFISIIRKKLTLYSKGAKIKEMDIEQAVMKIKQDMAHIYLGIEAFTLTDEDIEAHKNSLAAPQKT